MKHIRNDGMTGREALMRRDALEIFITSRFPKGVRPWVSATLTSITGLAPSNRAEHPFWKGSEFRALLYMLITLVTGTMMILLGCLFAKFVGGLAVISAMRNFSSSVGHQLTHSSKGLPWPDRWIRRGYNILSALLLLPTFEEYRELHRRHHGKVSGPGDPDQEFIKYLGARFDGFLWFFRTLLNPTLHSRFLAARIRAVVLKGPGWRRVLGAAGMASASLMPVPSLVVWLIFLLVGYQSASLVSFASLHLWGNRPPSAKPFEVATAVTFGRLLIPECTLFGLLCLPAYALVRALWLQGDLNNHDLHHIGKGPWTEAPYVRSRLILEGLLLRQTNGVRAMFNRAFAAFHTKHHQPSSQISDEQILGL